MIYFNLLLLDAMLLFDVLRQPLILVLFSVVNQTLEQTQQSTHALHESAMYELQFDCKKIYFEHFLNDQHDAVLRRIFIRDVPHHSRTWLYRRAEQNEPIYLYQRSEATLPVFLYRKSEMLGLLDFEVVVPLALTYNPDLLKSHIDTFRLPGMTYQIVSQ